MMKYLIALVIGLSILALPALSLAGVEGSGHDMLLQGADDLCFACHIPHNALGENLWARSPSGTFPGMQDLCYTCHDGSLTSVGSTTAFDVTDQQHKTVGSDCSGAGACHDVHDENPIGIGRFLVVTRTNNSYCETCHDATQFPGAEALGDHTAGLTHFTDGGAPPTGFTCNQCHSVHGATPQTTNPVGLTHPILLADNEPTNYYGAFCISCHSGTAPTEAVPGTGGVASSDPYDYEEAQNDGLETMHPTISTTGSFPVEGCDKCHDVHEPTAPVVDYILMTDNTDSGYCISCHDGVTGPDVDDSGAGGSHYIGVPTDVNMNSGLTPALPWADQIDEDGLTGADWASATPNMMVCESCHSVHREGWTGLDLGYFLRRQNGALQQLCSSCHIDN